MNAELLISAALDARENAYAPYSDFFVGAALETADGKIYTGCNLESASFSGTVCAERVALFKAVSEGETEFSALAVAGGGEGGVEDYCTPCGICLQVLSEFCPDSLTVILAKDLDDYEVVTLGDLLPRAFRIN